MRASLLSLIFVCFLGSSDVRAREYTVECNGQRMDVDIHFLLPAARRREVLNWVESTAEALAGVFGRWPRNEWRVEVKPIGIYTSDPELHERAQSLARELSEREYIDPLPGLVADFETLLAG